MKIFLVIGLSVLLALASLSASAQKEVVVDGTRYVLHTVSKSETVFSLCQKYKVTPKDLQQANPGLAGILQVGATVKIPVGKLEQQTVPAKPKSAAPTPTPTPTPTEETDYYYHKVAKNQTIFSIAKQYETTANDLIRNNPELTNGLKIGQILKIPVVRTPEQTGNAVGQKTDELAQDPNLEVHQVVSGETLYGLEQRYGVDHEAMLAANPDLKNGLKAGMKLRIPPVSKLPVKEPVSEPGNVIRYKVEQGETLFSLASRFGVEVSDIKKLNPSLLSRSLETGETILIPEQIKESKPLEVNVADNSTVPAVVLTDCAPSPQNKNKLYKVGFLLPFYLSDQPDSLGNPRDHLLDPLKFVSPVVSTGADSSMFINGANIDSRVNGFLEFYEGALVAIDSLRRQGMNIEVYTFDASSQDKINQLLLMDQFFELSLIVGPVYPELQQSVASFAAKNRIPMVSPLSPGGNFEAGNSWFFKVNPPREYQIGQTASFVASEFSRRNFFLIKGDGNPNDSELLLAKLCKEKLAQSGENRFFHEYNFQKQGVNDIKPLLDESGENIFVLQTDNEAQVSVAVTNLTALAEQYNIVLVGTSVLTKLRSIQTENFHRIRLHYLSPYFVDYERPLVKRFVSQYRDVFSAEPTPYSFQGFDVSFYFLSSLGRFGKDFRQCLASYPMNLTQMNFAFRKVSPMGGSVNSGLFVVAYERNFDIRNLGSYGDSR